MNEAPGTTTDPRALALARLLSIVDRLRAPDGCPWDRKQTLATMAPHLVEEAHEALEAIETGSDAQIAEEAGDDDGRRVDLPHRRGSRPLSTWRVRRTRSATSSSAATRTCSARRRSTPADQVVAELGSDQEERARGEAGGRERVGRRPRVAAGAAARATHLWQGHERRFPLGIGGRRRREAARGTGRARRSAPRERTRPRREGTRDGRAARAGRTRAGRRDIGRGLLGHSTDLDAEKLTREAIRRFETRFRSMEGALESPMKDHTLVELMMAWETAKSRT
ncbi:MAG: hypothetical protein IPJ19_18815 [Planctomycetes bacterium]|nr:hypothetical protein [Planctomycetota bacterium]